MGQSRTEEGSSDSAQTHLHDFLSHRREQVIREWERLVRSEPGAQPFSAPALRNHIEDLLEELAGFVRHGGTTVGPALGRLAEVHALDRLDAGFDVHTVLRELGVIRDVVFRQFMTQVGGRIGRELLEEFQRFDKALGEVSAKSVSIYAKARERTLVAMDRLSAAALGTGDLEAFLSRLLHVVLETTQAADYVTVFLREGDRLSIRAVAGPGSEASLGFSLGVGEGFAGRVAAEKAPLLLHSAANDPMVRNPFPREANIRALYGVPLVHENEVIGIAEVGSRSAFDFSADDKQLFRAMAQRATSLIVQAQLVDRLRAREAELDRRLASERTARAEAEKTLAILRMFAASTPLGFGCFDHELRYILVNEPLAELHGLSSVAHLGKTVRELFPTVAGFVEPILQRVLESGEVIPDVEIPVPCTDEPGQTCFRQVTYSPVRTAHGEVIGVGVIAMDITARKRAEQQAVRRADFAQELIAIVSHDLRSPISAILLSAGTLLKRTDMEHRQRMVLERMLSAAGRANRMISELLDFTRAQVGSGIPIELKTFEFDESVGQVLEEIRLAHPEREVHIALGTRGTGRWDPDRLAQVLTNLVTNALKHSPPGTPVRVRTHGDAEHVVFEVWNAGAIPEAERARLFEPYQRGRRASQEAPSGGVGLGLYITRQLIDAHHGRIDVRSSEEEGTTFIVTLPRSDRAP